MPLFSAVLASVAECHRTVANLLAYDAYGHADAAHGSAAETMPVLDVEVPTLLPEYEYHHATQHY